MLFSELKRLEAAVVFRLFLLDNIRLYRSCKVIRLAGQIRRDVVVGIVGLEGGISQIRPENR